MQRLTELFQSVFIERLLIGLSLLLVVLAHFIIFMVVPNERIMGAVQRIFYFHVGSAIACYCSFAIVFIASFGFLATRERIIDRINEAAAEVGFIFCSITLATGMIWGHSAWNTWFRWEPRLVTFLFLWLIFLAFNVMRLFGDRELLAAHTAVVGILGACMVPIVWISVKFLPQVAQLHPQVLENRGLKDSRFEAALLVSVVALITVQTMLIWMRTKLSLLADSIKE